MRPFHHTLYGTSVNWICVTFLETCIDENYMHVWKNTDKHIKHYTVIVIVIVIVIVNMQNSQRHYLNAYLICTYTVWFLTEKTFLT